jgi:Cu/Ag efflux pump CusA
LYISGYYLSGMMGMAIAYIILTGFYAIIQNSIIGKRLNIRLASSFWQLYLIGIVLSVASIVPLLIENNVIKIVANTMLLILAIGYAVYFINKKTSFIEKVKQIIYK